MENIKIIAQTLVEHQAYHHYRKIDLDQDELKNPIVVQAAMDYAIKKYKLEQSRIDPDSKNLDHWQDVFWFIAQNYR